MHKRFDLVCTTQSVGEQVCWLIEISHSNNSRDRTNNPFVVFVSCSILGARIYYYARQTHLAFELIKAHDGERAVPFANAGQILISNRWPMDWWSQKCADASEMALYAAKIVYKWMVVVTPRFGVN